jgi:hypothetical protein
MELVLPRGADAGAQIEGLRASRLRPFDPRVLAFLDAFSRRVLGAHEMRRWPELMALAYWFRPAAVAQLRDRHERLGAAGVLRPRGVALHFCPANVDSVFVYSWFLSMLCGNRNIVRISARDSGRRQLLLELIAEQLAQPEHRDVANATAVLSYPHDELITARLSSHCDIRVVWGGDRAVRDIRRAPLPPLATEIVFPDRQSWAILSSAAVNGAGESEMGNLAASFFNDAFWFGQQACSSPRAVLWLGDEGATGTARARFWAALQAVAARRGAATTAEETMARINAAHSVASIVPVERATPLSSWPLRLEVERLDAVCREAHCGYGLFLELRRSGLDDARDLFAGADQTLAVFGIDQEELRDWIAGLADRAIDRIVPVGDALRFADYWDGLDLIQSFSRLVTIR